MKIFSRTFFLILSVLWIWNAPVHAGLQEGMKAYDLNEFKTALQEFSPLAKQGNSNAQFMMGQMARLGQGRSTDFINAIDWYQRAAQNGHASAQIALAIAYYYGRGTIQDYKKALHWRKQASDQGSGTAMGSIAMMYAAGEGVPKDMEKAYLWLKKSAAFGDFSSEQMLVKNDVLSNKQQVFAEINYTIKFVERASKAFPETLVDDRPPASPAMLSALKPYIDKNYSLALRRLQPFAENGDPVSAFHIGNIYFFGQGTAVNYAKALRWYKQAAAGGIGHVLRPSSFQVATIYLNGLGVNKDMAKFVKWLKISANAGYVNAQRFLGNMYDDGTIIKGDKALAIKWYQTAALNADAVSAYLIAAKLYTGDGVPVDKRKSIFWFRKAAGYGSPEAIKLLKKYNIPLKPVEKNIEFIPFMNTALTQEHQQQLNGLLVRYRAFDGDAAYELGQIFSQGLGVEKDKARAFKWYKRAAELFDHEQGKFLLGLAYLNGTGTPQNTIEAIRTFQELAEIDYQPAIKKLEELKTAEQQ